MGLSMQGIYTNAPVLIVIDDELPYRYDASRYLCGRQVLHISIAIPKQYQLSPRLFCRGLQAQAQAQ